jgi:endonuclease YncB( thermonuclease family)
MLLAVGIVLALSACRSDAPPDYRPTHAHARYLDVSRVRFDDGDSFYLDGKPIRILGMDAPETKSPEVGIFVDQPFGPAAAESTKAIMKRARLLEIIPDGKGTYGRRLAHVLVDGELLAVKMIEMGLAYENVSFFGDNGFPDLADRILKASLQAPKPPFQQPYRWRKKNQKRSNN